MQNPNQSNIIRHKFLRGYYYRKPIEALRKPNLTLIELIWNRNAEFLVAAGLADFLLIEPAWNRNGSWRKLIVGLSCAFNRTSMELKPISPKYSNPSLSTELSSAYSTGGSLMNQSILRQTLMAATSMKTDANSLSPRSMNNSNRQSHIAG